MSASIPLAVFPVLLLDVNSTFMFGEDRFGPDQDYFVAYTEAGGRELSSERVRTVVDSCIACLKPIYLDPDRCDSFPSVKQILTRLPESHGLPRSELELLEAVVAGHEVGRIPESYAAALASLAQSHRLGVVSNIWCGKEPWIREMEHAGVLELFEAMVFSSDGESMKPSPRLFDLALTGMGVSAADAVFIGDSLRCDVAGAAAVGMATIWIDHHGVGVPGDGPHPTWVIRDLLDLVAVATTRPAVMT